MEILVYPGSFDPITIGHVDIARRAAKLCETLYVVIMRNPSKKTAFSPEERAWMAEVSLKPYHNIKIDINSGLLVDYVRQKKACAVVRGLRSESDFRFEAEMAAANRLLYSDYETIMLPCSANLGFTSSSIVREVAAYGGDISGMVPFEVRDYIAEHLIEHQV
ncbi:MAG: pantetheine-phosphate adenylyltransferase [Clostridiaceae bacterium]|nr:pantetheine-phosphate adenylyltransferase [Clostridiaceae bacterium]